jgi:3-oxoadipate enol-lactonase
MGSITTRGATLAYADSGPRDAPAVLFLHALGAHSAMWDAQAAALGGVLRILRTDLRGHGQSRLVGPANDAAPEYTIADLAADAIAVLDDAGVQRAAWVGLSIGGMTALWGAARHGERVSALVASNSSPGPAPREQWQQRRDTALAQGLAPLVEPTLERWFTPAFRASAPQEVERVRRMFQVADARAYAGCCAAIRDQDQRAGLALIQAPTLVIAGVHDTATPAALSEVIHAAVRGSHLEVLDAAHLSNVECAARYNALLVPFLERHATA